MSQPRIWTRPRSRPDHNMNTVKIDQFCKLSAHQKLRIRYTGIGPHLLWNGSQRDVDEIARPDSSLIDNTKQLRTPSRLNDK